MFGSAMPVNVTQLPTGTQLPSASNSASGSGSNTTLTQNDFFHLMTAQLESQDPLNPMNSDRDVAVSGNLLAYGGSGSAQGAFNLSSAAANVTVTVTDASGAQVATINLGPMGAGMQNFSWNGSETGGGTATAGAYTFQVNAMNTRGNAIAATPYAVVPVAGVTVGGQNGPTVSLAGGLGTVTLNQIYQIY